MRKDKRAFLLCFLLVFPCPSSSVEVVSKVGAAVPWEAMCSRCHRPSIWAWCTESHIWLSKKKMAKVGVRVCVSPSVNRRTDLRQNHRKLRLRTLHSAEFGDHHSWPSWLNKERCYYYCPNKMVYYWEELHLMSLSNQFWFDSSFGSQKVWLVISYNLVICLIQQTLRCF